MICASRGKRHEGSKAAPLTRSFNDLVKSRVDADPALPAEVVSIIDSVNLRAAA
jgi:hypothetical protein